MSFIEIKNLCFRYKSRTAMALNNINLQIEEGSFNLIIGKSGSGKTTFLKHLKNEVRPSGETGGEVLFEGRNLFSFNLEESAKTTGFVFQNIDEQIVTDKVFSELAFGLENLGYSSEIIERRIAETVAFFGLHDKMNEFTHKLSGGEKQLLNLAAIMIMQPKVLILDEPTAQLDPIAANEFLMLIKKINTEFGTTVIISEHRTEDIFPLCDKVILMESGSLTSAKSPNNMFDYGAQFENDISLDLMLPTALRLFKSFKTQGDLPICVNDAVRMLKSLVKSDKIKIKKTINNYEIYNQKKTAVELKNVCFRFEKNSPDILKNASLKVEEGGFICLMGGNGSGKTTALSIIGALRQPYSGSVRIFDKAVKDYKNGSLYDGVLSALPQNPLNIFVCETVLDDLLTIDKNKDNVIKLAKRLGIAQILQSHPYDLSGGEAQKAALCKVLLTKPKILLLDEPTKGLDAEYKLFLGGFLKELNNEGVTVICVTHDTEFAASFSKSCCLFFDGGILAPQTAHDFFNGNYFYTTAANRIARTVGLDCVTAQELIDSFDKV